MCLTTRIFLIYFLSLPYFSKAQALQSIEEDTAAFTVNMDEFLVTAQYKPTHYKNALYKVEVIRKEDMDLRGVTQLDQALLISSSVRFDQDPILGPQIRLRGLSSSNVAILIDGIPVIGRLNGSVDLSQIPTQNIQRVEVVEGPLSTIYGSNATGGVINIITKTTPNKSFTLQSEHQIESIGTLSNQVRVGFKAGKFGGSAHGRLFSYDQFPSDSLRILDEVTLSDGNKIMQARYPWNPKDQKSAGGDLGYYFDDENSIRLKYDYNIEEVIDYGSIKRPRFNPYANDLFFNTQRSDVSFVYDGLIKNKYYVEASIALNGYQRTVKDSRYYLETQTFDSLLHVIDTTLFTSAFSRLNLGFDVAKNLDAVLGMTHTFERGAGDRILDLNQKDSTSTQVYETAWYGELKYHPGSRWQISGSSRLTSHSRYNFNFTPALQMKFAINEHWSVRSSLAAGYRNPALKELNIEFIDVNHYIIGNPDLKPETSTDIQLNLTYSKTSSFTTNLNLYKTDLKNRITLAEFETLRYRYENVDEYGVMGIQSSVQWKYSNFQYQGSGNLGFWSTSLEGEELPSFGRVLDMNHALSYFIPGIETIASANLRHVGAQPLYRLTNEELTISKVESQNFLDFSLSKSIFKKKVNLTAGIKNVLDIKNAQVIGAGGGGGTHSSGGASRLVSQGRNYFARVSFQI